MSKTYIKLLIIIFLIAFIATVLSLGLLTTALNQSGTLSEFSFKHYLRGIKYVVKKDVLKKKVGSIEDALFHKETIETSYFSIQTYLGWASLTANNGYHSWRLKNGRTVSFEQLADIAKASQNYQDGFHYSPGLTIYKAKFDVFEQDRLLNKPYIFFTEHTYTKESKEMNGKTLNYWRYFGKANIYANDPENTYNNNSDTVSIYFQFADLSAWGFFWGFEEDEEVFWECLNSIEWKDEINR